MAVTILIPTALRQYAGGSAELSVEARTVGEALEQLTREHAELRKHLFNEQNKLRNFVNVYVNDEDIRHRSGLETPVRDGDTVMIVPSIAGGATIEADLERKVLPTLTKEEIARYSRHLIMPEVGMEVEGGERVDDRDGRARGSARLVSGGGRSWAARRRRL
jgi:adenylyltransferase/sulfurtransferase